MATSNVLKQLMGDNTAPMLVTTGAGGGANVTIAGPDPLNVNVTNAATPVVLKDGANVDAYDRLRISEVVTLFDSKPFYTLPSLLFGDVQTGTGVATALEANTRLVVVSVNPGIGTSVYQTFEYFNYQAGKSQVVVMSFVLGSSEANAVKRVGYFDADNGIFLEQNGPTGLVNLVLRSKTSGVVVDTAIPQSAWNLDPLDGTGDSGITLDLTRVQIFFVDFQFGMGRVRCGFDILGKITYCHQFLHTNVISVPFMQTGNLPARAEVSCDGASGGTMRLKCVSIMSEGGITKLPEFSGSTAEASVTTVSGSRVALWSIRPTLLFNGMTNRSRVIPTELHIVNTGNQPIFYELVIGANFSVLPVFFFVDSTFSAAEFAPGGTFSNLTGGFVVRSGYVSSTNQSKDTVNEDLTFLHPITLDAAGSYRSLGTLTLLVTGIGGTPGCRASLNFTESR